MKANVESNLKDAAMMELLRAVRINFSRLRSFESLPEEAWRDIDNVLIRTAKEELNGIADLNRYGLVRAYDGMSAAVYTRKRISELGDATVAVTPDNQADGGILDMSDISVPMLVTYKDFNVNTAQTAMAARVGLPLNFALVEEATRSVARTLEYNLFNASITANGATQYGYFEFPSAQTHTISTAWTTATPQEIISDVIEMITLSREKNHRGPWVLYIPWAYEKRMMENFLTTTTNYPTGYNIREEIMKLDPGRIEVRQSNAIEYSAGVTEKVVLVEMSSMSVELISAMPIRAVAWEPPGTPNWDHKFKVMTMQIPLLIDDYEGQCGIVIGTI